MTLTIIPPSIADLAEYQINKYWDDIPTIEPISDHLKALVREDLMKKWHYLRNDEFRRTMRLNWSSLDSEKIVLEDAIGQLKPRELKYLCNKATAAYILPLSARLANAPIDTCGVPGILFQIVCGEWFQIGRISNVEPSIEFGHFFANAVRVTSTGPSTVRGVIDAHLSLCAQASGFMNQAKNGDDDMIRKLSSISRCLEHYSLLPLYHAVVVIFDRLELHRDNLEKDPDGYISLRKYAPFQSVLIARTGMEEGLSAPISFDSLRSDALSLEDCDAITSGVVDDVVRVSVPVAVRFIAGLEAREELAFPKPNNDIVRDEGLGPSSWCGILGGYIKIDKNPEAWADVHIKLAEEHGYDSMTETSDSIRRVKASLVGEICHDLNPVPIEHRWKY